VPILSLRQKRSRPPTEQLSQVQSRLWNTPLSFLRTPLVAAICEIREQRHRNRCDHQKTPIDPGRKTAKRVTRHCEKQKNYRDRKHTNTPIASESPCWLRWSSTHCQTFEISREDRRSELAVALGSAMFSLSKNGEPRDDSYEHHAGNATGSYEKNTILSRARYLQYRQPIPSHCRIFLLFVGALRPMAPKCDAPCDHERSADSGDDEILREHDAFFAEQCYRDKGSV